MKLYQEWRSGKGEGATLTILQLLAWADSEYKRLSQLGQWETKNKSGNLLGLQAKFDVLQSHFVAFSRNIPNYKTNSLPNPINLKVNLNQRRKKNALSMARNGITVQIAELVAVGIKLTKQANTKRASVNQNPAKAMMQKTNSRLLQHPTMLNMALIRIFSLAKTANYAFT